MRTIKIIILILLMVACVVSTFCVTKESINSKAEVEELTFLGTYEIDDNGNKYLSVFENKDSFSYLIFDDNNAVLSEGVCKEGYRSLSIIDSNSNICIGTLVYSFGDYIYSESEKVARKTKKVSEGPIIPSE